MRKSLGVAWLCGTVLLAGCGSVETRPQVQRGTAVPLPEPGSVQPEQGQAGATDPQPDEPGTQKALAEEGKPVIAEPAETRPDRARRDAKTENISTAETTAPSQTEPVHADAPVQGQKPESSAPKPNEPSVTASVPTQHEDVIVAAGEDAVSTVFREYAEILKTYVHEDGRVDYGALHRRRLDLKPLLMKLGELRPNVYQGWSREEKLAFWINSYNLKMLDIISKNYPIQSSWWLRLTWPPDDIRHIRGIWTDFKLVVMDEEFTLGEIERRLFQKTFDDPRVYLALTYASQSSPFLRRQPYRGDSLHRQLDEQVRQFLSSPQGLQIDRRNRVVRLCALFKPTWRGEEFVARYGTDKKFKTCDPSTRAVLSFITSYLSRDDVYFLEVENYTIEYINFDWRLNDTARGY